MLEGGCFCGAIRDRVDGLVAYTEELVAYTEERVACPEERK
jgi:hypothetical protein